MINSEKRNAFVAEVHREMNVTGATYDRAYRVVLGRHPEIRDPQLPGNRVFLNSTESKAATDRTLEFQRAVRKLMDEMHWDQSMYNVAFNTIMRQRPDLADAMKQPSTPAIQQTTSATGMPESAKSRHPDSQRPSRSTPEPRQAETTAASAPPWIKLTKQNQQMI